MLPTKVNLKQWGKVSNYKCFCGKRQTLKHILSCCNRSLKDGRYTFRHDSILNYISSCLDKTKFKCHVDIPGEQTAAGGTLSPSLVVSNLKPDIVIENRTEKTLSLFELTVPGEQRIDISNKLKYEKYEHFVNDIKTHKTSVIPFEIGAHTGYISSENKTRLKQLHKFCKPNITMKKFTQNISAIVVLGSYFIFNCRNQDSWDNTDLILPPF